MQKLTKIFLANGDPMSDTMTRDTTRTSSRIIKYDELKPCFNAFIDSRTPGSDKKENFTIIGPGVSENPEQFVHIAEPHGFNIGGARQPPGCTNSQHSHRTVEVFYVHSGHWRFDLGEHGEDAQVALSPGDLISIPTSVFRGFTNIGQTPGFLWAVLGGDDPGRVLWAPQVFEMASTYGLVLLEDGSLIDTARGEVIPEGKSPMPVTSRAQVEALISYSKDELEACVARSGTHGPRGPLDRLSGVSENLLVGAGRMDWSHGFRISEILITPSVGIPAHRLDVPDVWFVQSGNAIIKLQGTTTIVGPGDTMTFPRREPRSMRNVGDEPVRMVAVRGGDAEASLLWS
jgi:mannose-6-phosphate isomerase-like protein (cupin superfamily)